MIFPYGPCEIVLDCALKLCSTWRTGVSHNTSLIRSSWMKPLTQNTPKTRTVVFFLASDDNVSGTGLQSNWGSSGYLFEKYCASANPVLRC